MNVERKKILVVGNRNFCSDIEKCCGDYALLIFASDIQAALDSINRKPIGVNFDVLVTEDSGLVLVETIREEGLVLPVLVYYKKSPDVIIKRTFQINYWLIYKPVRDIHIRGLLDRVNHYQVSSAARLSSAMFELSWQWKLSDRQKDILTLLLLGVRPKHMAGLLDISTNTLKTHIRSLLYKSKSRDIAQISNKVFFHSLDCSDSVEM